MIIILADYAISVTIVGEYFEYFVRRCVLGDIESRGPLHFYKSALYCVNIGSLEAFFYAIVRGYHDQQRPDYARRTLRFSGKSISISPYFNMV